MLKAPTTKSSPRLDQPAPPTWKPPSLAENGSGSPAGARLCWPLWIACDPSGFPVLRVPFSSWGASETQSRPRQSAPHRIRSTRGATATFVPAPALVGNKTMRKPAERCSDGIHRQGMGTPHHGASRHWQPPAVSAVARQRAMQTSPDQDRLHAAGAVGDVCLRFFDSAGTLVPSDLDDRVVGIDADTLRRIPRIGIAGGESKHKAIHAAVSGGWVNVLITDTGTAAALLRLT